MHEEQEVSRKGEQVIMRTGQLVMRPASVVVAALLRAVGRQAAKGVHGATVETLGNIPYMGETGLVRLEKLHEISRRGTSTISVSNSVDKETKEFAHLMAKFGVPFTLYADKVSGEKFLVYRPEDTDAITTGLQSCLAESLGDPGLAQRVADPTRELGVDDAMKVSEMKWAESPEGNGWQASQADDLGNTLLTTVRKDGSWTVVASDGTGVSQCLATSPAAKSGEARPIGDALLRAASAAKSLAAAQERKAVESEALKTPEQARNAVRARLGIDQQVHEHDQGPRQSAPVGRGI
jgi:hypothetical protein